MFRFCVRNNQHICINIRIVLSLILTVLIISPITLWGQVEFFQILPNTVDDTNLEYIEFRNTGCEDIDIGWYVLEDASQKQYIFPPSTLLVSHETLHVWRPTSKIILNNTSEVLYLKRSDGTIEDQFAYETSTKWVTIVDLTVIDGNCTVHEDIGNINSGNTDTGGIDMPWENSQIDPSFSGIIEGTWVIDIESTGYQNTETGTTDTGTTDTGTTDTNSVVFDTGIILVPSNEVSSWEVLVQSKPATGSMIISSGSTESWILFPEIIPTLQQPTNAIFSWGIFDCTGHDPCRINMTLDPIFTGAFLAKNYTCEVITDTGSIMSCNPNTLYFSTGGSLGIRLTSKIDQSQSRGISWDIIFGSVETQSLVVVSWSVQSQVDTNTGTVNFEASFPDIIPTFQNYTNTTNSDNILTCITNPCRVNFTLDPVFTGVFLARDYTCDVIYGTGSYNSCNPPQLYLIGTGTIEINVIHRASWEKRTKTLEIIQDIATVTTTSDPKNQIGDIRLDTNVPIIVLEYDGKMKSYHEILWEYEINCYALTCAVNLTAEKSYDPEWWSVRFLWYYGANDIKTTKDPWEHKYGLGDHEIWLRVMDSAGNMTQIRYHIHVLGVPEKWEKPKEEKKTKTKQIKNESISPKIKKKKNPKKITFFEPPNLVLQNSKFTETRDGYICRTNTKTCSLNLSLSGSQKGIIYSWIYDNGEGIISKNPKSKSFVPWTHTIRVIAGYSDSTPIWSRDIHVEVIKVKKPKKIKKIKVSKIVQKSWSTIVNTTTQNPPEEQKTSDNIPFVTLALIGGIMPILVLRRVFSALVWKI